MIGNAMEFWSIIIVVALLAVEATVAVGEKPIAANFATKFERSSHTVQCSVTPNKCS